MKSSRRSVAVFALLLVVFASIQWGAPTGAQNADELKPPQTADQVPRAALLTERGRQLAEELRMLKRNQESMGAKHPALPAVKKKIEAITEQLQAWEPAVGDAPENPFHTESSTPQMNEYDLRQIVIQLSRRVDALEKRVSTLEKR